MRTPSAGFRETHNLGFQGEVVRIARQRRGMTQGELEQATGLAQSTISRLESGRESDPPLSAVGRLSHALHLWPQAFQPWGLLDPPDDSVGPSTAGCLMGRISTHFLHLGDQLSRTMHYCLRDALLLRPDLSGLSVWLFHHPPVGQSVAAHCPSLTGDILVHESSFDLSSADPELQESLAAWQRGEPLVRRPKPTGRRRRRSGESVPALSLDYPVRWGAVRWDFAVERETESAAQRVRWVGPTSRIVEQGVEVFARLRAAGKVDAPDVLEALRRRLARVELLLGVQAQP